MSKKQLRKRRRAYTRQFFRGNWGLLALSLLYILILCMGGGLMISWLMQVITDTATGVEGAYTLGQLLLLCLLDAGLVALGSWLIWLSKPRFIAKAIGQYQEFVFQKLTEKGIAAFSGENTSLYLSALTNDANSIEQDLLANICPLIEELLMFAGALALMLWYSPLLTAVGVALALLPVAASLLAGNRVAEAEKRVSEKNDAYVSTLNDCLSGFAVIKAFRAEAAMCRQASRRIRELSDAKTLRRKAAVEVQCMGMVAGLIAQLGVFLVGAALALYGQPISAGMLIAFVNLMNYVVTPISTVPQYLAQCRSSLALIDKLAEAVEQNLRNEGREEKTELEREITVEELSFSYGETPTLQNISVTFEAGKSYAIVGASGSGKSTLLNLLMAARADYTGSIRYDGTELRQLSSASVYELVSLIQQNVFLFNASIRENVTMFSDFSEEQVNRALELSGLSGLIARRGEDYLCGENGCKLSGGEKQRIAIARSLLKHAQVLLVDEATAALDSKTAWQVTDAILNLNGLTRIVVTHALHEALLRRFDTILTLKNGTLTEAGSFDALMEKKGYFYSLYNVTAR